MIKLFVCIIACLLGLNSNGHNLSLNLGTSYNLLEDYNDYVDYYNALPISDSLVEIAEIKFFRNIKVTYEFDIYKKMSASIKAGYELGLKNTKKEISKYENERKIKFHLIPVEFLIQYSKSFFGAEVIPVLGFGFYYSIYQDSVNIPVFKARAKESYTGYNLGLIGGFKIKKYISKSFFIEPNLIARYLKISNMSGKGYVDDPNVGFSEGTELIVEEYKDKDYHYFGTDTHPNQSFGEKRKAVLNFSGFEITIGIGYSF